MSLVRFEPRPRPESSEIGAPGTRHWSGIITTDEYNPELTGSRALDVFERMRRSDGTVQGTLRALKLPILSAESEIDPASADAVDVEIATFVRWNFFEGLTHSWAGHLRQALTCVDFGFSVFELVWGEPRRDIFVPTAPLESRDLFALHGQLEKIQALIDQPAFDGERIAAEAAKERLLARYGRTGTGFDRPMVWLRKIAPRLQRTIHQWKLARDGGLESIRQNLFGSSPGDGFVDIPVEKLAVYVHDQEGANWTGMSALRPAYKHWFIKDQLYRFQAMNAERFGVGIPVVTVGPDDSGDTQKMDRAEAIGEGVRAHEKGNVTLPHDWKFMIAGIEGQVLDLEPAIRAHDSAITRSVLANFLSLGEKREGSHALSGDQSSFFLMAERALADELCDVVNRFVIPKLVDANWSGVTKYPRLAIRKIETRELEKFFNALATAAGQQLITPDDPTENELREMAGLRPLDRQTARERVTPAPAPQPQPEGQRPGTEPPPGDGGEGA